MLENLRHRHPGSSVQHLVGFEFSRFVLTTLFSGAFRARSYGWERVPVSGPVLIAANHQSFIDPPLIGTCIRPRHADFVARASLFRFRPFGALLEGVNCIPLQDDQGDAGAIREVLRRLELGRAVVIFPEGNRTPDGAMHAFKRGVALIVKRARCPVVPVAVEGCFDAWPRTRAVPRLGSSPIGVMFGHPIPHAELMSGGGDAALRRLEREIDALRLDLRARIRRTTRGSFPARGPGDRPFAPP